MLFPQILFIRRRHVRYEYLLKQIIALAFRTGTDAKLARRNYVPGQTTVLNYQIQFAIG